MNQRNRAGYPRAPCIAVVGAGVAGLAAAGHLQDRGLNVTVFDKGRRPGGRANTREHGSRRFDHGAQFFTVRDPFFRERVNLWRGEGVLAPWHPRIAYIGGPRALNDQAPVRNSAEIPAGEPARFVGKPGMVSVALRMARGLDVRCGVRIVGVERQQDGWYLGAERGDRFGPFLGLLVGVPGPQAVPLLPMAPHLQEVARSTSMDPCWAVMVSFSEPLEVDFDVAQFGDGALAWMARESSKPGRPDSDGWVLHAHHPWSKEHQGVDADTMADRLVAELSSTLGSLPPVAFKRGHFWRFALASRAAFSGPLYDPDLDLGICGDWCREGRVEGAFLSGLHLAKEILAKASFTHDSNSPHTRS